MLLSGYNDAIFFIYTFMSFNFKSSVSSPSKPNTYLSGDSPHNGFSKFLLRSLISAFPCPILFHCCDHINFYFYRKQNMQVDKREFVDKLALFLLNLFYTGRAGPWWLAGKCRSPFIFPEAMCYCLFSCSSFLIMFNFPFLLDSSPGQLSFAVKTNSESKK